MVIGEAPGAEEDPRAGPFVGRAGGLLNSMLRAAGFKRGDVYMANVLKCRLRTIVIRATRKRSAACRTCGARSSWWRPK